jgi:hypothetical protein
MSTDDRTGTAALDMISKISLDREETHLVPLVCSSMLYITGTMLITRYS